MSNYRRNLLVNYKLNSYIADGLVFQLCGEDATSSNWIDRIGKNNFTLYNCALGDKCVTFNGSSSYGVCVGKDYPYNTSTIEVVVSSSNMSNTQLFFMGKTKSICIGTYAGNYIISNAGYITYRYKINNANSNIRIVSLNTNLGYENTVKSIANGTDTWSGGNTNMYIGRRSTGNFFTGNIYQIRIYNRLLTKDEMLHNQHIDINKYGIKI